MAHVMHLQRHLSQAHNNPSSQALFYLFYNQDLRQPDPGHTAGSASLLGPQDFYRNTEKLLKARGSTSLVGETEGLLQSHLTVG